MRINYSKDGFIEVFLGLVLPCQGELEGVAFRYSKQVVKYKFTFYTIPARSER